MASLMSGDVNRSTCQRFSDSFHDRFLDGFGAIDVRHSGLIDALEYEDAGTSYGLVRSARRAGVLKRMCLSTWEVCVCTCVEDDAGMVVYRYVIEDIKDSCQHCTALGRPISASPSRIFPP